MNDAYFQEWIGHYDSAIADGMDADDAARVADLACSLVTPSDEGDVFWVQLLDGDRPVGCRVPLNFLFDSDGRHAVSTQTLHYVDLPWRIRHPVLTVWIREHGGLCLVEIDVQCGFLYESGSLRFDPGTVSMVMVPKMARR